MTVYVVQQQVKYDPAAGKSVPRFSSIDKAEKFGQLEFLLGPQAHPYEPENPLGTLHEKLVGFSDDDYLLLIGNPVLIGLAASVAAFYNQGKVKFLQWSGQDKEYSEIAAKIHSGCPE